MKTLLVAFWRTIALSRPALAALLLSTFALMSSADESLTPSGLSLELIMADPDWIGNPPQNPRFSDDGKSILFEQKRDNETIRDLYRTDPQSDQHTRVDETAWSALNDFPGVISADGRRKVFLKDDDVYLKDLRSGATTRITRSTDKESAVGFSADDEFVMFKVGNALFRYAIANGVLEQYAAVLAKEDPLDEDDDYSFLEHQQQTLFTSLEDDKRKEKNLKTRSRDRAAIKPIYLGKEIEIRSITASPRMNVALLVTRKESDDSDPDVVMPNYVTDDGYVTNRDVRAKVGESARRPETLLVANLKQQTTMTVDLTGLDGIKSDPLKSLRKSALVWHVANGADESKIEKKLEAPDVRGISVIGARWNSAGTRLAVQLRAQDNKDRWLVSIDPETGKAELEHRLPFDDGWVNWSNNNFGWTHDGERLWFLSEESGFSNLYLKRPGKRKAINLTEGRYVVGSPVEGRDGKYFYVTANKDDPGEYRLYRVASDGKSEPEAVTSIFTARQRLTQDNSPPFALSIDESRVLFRHSKPNQPTEVYVQENRPGATAQRVTHTVSQQFENLRWRTPQFVDVPSSHGAGTIRSRLYRPVGVGENKPRPAVIFVHGAGYLQNAHNGWSSYFREYMFHNLLTEHGVVVLDMDYRGSRGYGSDWRTAIYRQMGHPELEDLLDGVEYLIEREQVDLSRIGIYGGSYGGFMTFMALFRAPETFAAGAALRPVTDWAHYNHGYTSNILNTPLLDPEAYLKSSPIYYAEQYANRPMLIAHGMQDDNVHFQDSVRLVQRLIELKKENFETAIYPLDPHGFKYPESWLDEYRRIFKLFKENLEF